VSARGGEKKYDNEDITIKHRRNENVKLQTWKWRYASKQLVETLRYKPKGRGFDSR
jgi:hypothetical protein